MSDDAALRRDASAVEAVLESRWPRDGRVAGRIFVEGPVFAGRYSSIFRARIPGVETELAVKQCFHPATGDRDPAAAAAQYNALRTVHEAMNFASDASYRVPVPYLLVEEDALLAMEWVAGSSITRRLLSLRHGPAGGIGLMRRAGGWLGAFQAARRLPPRALDVTQKLEGTATIARSPLFVRATVRRALDALDRHAAQARARDVGQSWVHGDFKTDNLLVAGERIVGIDVHIRHENADLYDRAAFLNHLDLTLLHPLGLRWLPWRTRLARAFLDGAEPGAASAAQVPLWWAALCLMLDNWSESSVRRTRAPAATRYIDGCFDLVVARRIADLERAVRLA